MIKLISKLRFSFYVAAIIMLLGAGQVLKAETIFDDDNTKQEVLMEDSLSHDDSAQHMSHVCYPWYWTMNAWHHHHVAYRYGRWQHIYVRSSYVWNNFHRRYVWQCTWNGCWAWRF